MKPITLDLLLKQEGVLCKESGLFVTIHPSWIVTGEDRLSYTNIIRLVECCREYHWNNDIMAKITETPIDSITKSIDGNFITPIYVGSQISITYKIIGVRRIGYTLKFEICQADTYTLHAVVVLVSVFYDPLGRKAIRPPDLIMRYLSSACAGDSVLKLDTEIDLSETLARELK